MSERLRKYRNVVFVFIVAIALALSITGVVASAQAHTNVAWKSYSYTLYATNQHIGTKIFVPDKGTIRITANGLASVNPNLDQSDPTGDEPNCDSANSAFDWPYPGKPCWSVVGYIVHKDSTTSKPFEIGFDSGKKWLYRGGEIFVGINDPHCSDNVGFFTLRITVRHN